MCILCIGRGLLNACSRRFKGSSVNLIYPLAVLIVIIGLWFWLAVLFLFGKTVNVMQVPFDWLFEAMSRWW